MKRPVEGTGYRAVAAIRHRVCPSRYQISTPESAGEWVYAWVIVREWLESAKEEDSWLCCDWGCASSPRHPRDFLARDGREAGADTPTLPPQAGLGGAEAHAPGVAGVVERDDAQISM